MSIAMAERTAARQSRRQFDADMDDKENETVERATDICTGRSIFA